MTYVQWIPVTGVILMTVATIGLGLWATRAAKTAADFFVAGRSVSVFWNASAISGEYLSAASFMGIAGLLMKVGYDALWYPACYAAGYLFLLLFIAGPLRRFGAYTIPDFAEGRFDSPAFRKVAVTFVLFIGFFYTMPQMKGAGLVLRAILDWPYWAGISVVGFVITFNVAFGGMKGITFVQAFQYWAKVFAISLPIFIIAQTFHHYPTNLKTIATNPATVPLLGANSLEAGKLLKLKGQADYPSNVLACSPLSTTVIHLPEGGTIARLTSTRPFKEGEDSDLNLLRLAPENGPDSTPGQKVYPADSKDIVVPRNFALIASPVPVTMGGTPVVEGGKPVYTSARIEFQDPTKLWINPGTPSPNAPTNAKWIHPFGPMTSKHGYPLLYTYSLIIALICGTAGLPHILVRFYTNPDGRAAKRTTLWVMVMLGAFYVFPPIWGSLGRLVEPSLYVTGATDQVVISLPMKLQNQFLGSVLSAITSAGAFAAFMSTFSGLLVSMSGALAHDIYGKILKPKATPSERMRMFKISAVIIGLASMGLGLLVETFDIAMMVGWAFAIAACSYFPLLLLGAWWPGLTKFGAGCGMLGGGLLSVGAIVTSMLLDKKVLSFTVSPLTRSLMEQPAIWGVPLAFLLMIVVSKLTQSSIPSDIHLKMLRLHAPEELGYSKNYIEQ